MDVEEKKSIYWSRGDFEQGWMRRETAQGLIERIN